MFAVVEAYERIGADDDDSSSTCLTHCETKQQAAKEAYEGNQLNYDLRVERYAYFVVEFEGECPNCGRNFEF